MSLWKGEEEDWMNWSGWSKAWPANLSIHCERKSAFKLFARSELTQHVWPTLDGMVCIPLVVYCDWSGGPRVSNILLPLLYWNERTQLVSILSIKWQGGSEEVKPPGQAQTQSQSILYPIATHPHPLNFSWNLRWLNTAGMAHSETDLTTWWRRSPILGNDTS